MDRPFTSKLPVSMGGSDFYLFMVPWSHPSPQPKRHLDQLSHFCRLTFVTDRPTDHPTRSVTIGRLYLRPRNIASIYGLVLVSPRPPRCIALEGHPRWDTKVRYMLTSTVVRVTYHQAAGISDNYNVLKVYVIDRNYTRPMLLFTSAIGWRKNWLFNIVVCNMCTKHV